MAPESSPAPPAGPVAAAERSRSAIEEEHRILRSALEQLRHTRDLQALVTQLDALRLLLVDHFTNEETADGLLAAVERSASYAKVNEVGRLIDQHRALLDEVERLAAHARECVAGPFAVFAGVGDLIRELEEHERAETDLFAEAVTLELGASG